MKKKKQQQAHRLLNRMILLTLLMLFFTGSLGLGTVWLRHRISQTANATRGLEIELQRLERRVSEANAQVAAAHQPEFLVRQNERFQLGLQRPRDPQVVHVREEVEIRLATKRHQELFGSVPLPASAYSSLASR